MSKTPLVRTTFARGPVQKRHTAVAWSTCRSENAQNTPFSGTFGSWDVEKLHAAVNMCETHHMFGPLLEVAMSKSARRCSVKHISKLNVKNTPRSDHFCAFKRHFVWQAQLNQWILHLAKRVKRAGFCNLFPESVWAQGSSNSGGL